MRDANENRRTTLCFVAQPRAHDGTWQPWFAKAVDIGTYLLLTVGALTAILGSARTWEYHLGTLGLVGVAAAWELFTFTLPPREWLRSTYWVVFTLVGFLTIASILMVRDTAFLVFMIAAFFHALVLRPAVLMFTGLAACSVLIHSIPVGGPLVAFTENPGLYLTIVVVQTLAIGSGSIVTDQVFEQNEQRRKALNELEAALAENAGLHAQLVTQAREAGVLDERQRMAREIHDTLAQSFTGIVTQLEAAEQARQHPGQWRAHVDRARNLARQGLTEARRSVQAIGPESLETHALAEAVAELTERWKQTSGVTLTFETTGPAKPMLAEIEIALYRVAQEALTNVSKHANASKVGVTLSYMDDMVLLDVRDDGIGFTDATASPSDGHGFGLDAMRQRLRRVAGDLEVESTPYEGTAISASVPAIPAEASQ